MFVSDFFIWVYCLAPLDLCFCLLICTLILILAHQHLRSRGWWRWLLIALLSVWLIASVWMTVLNRSNDISEMPQFIPFYSLWTAYATQNMEILRSNFMNVALFYPAGLLLALVVPYQWSFFRRFLMVTMVFALYSLTIELMQYLYHLGHAEMDDIIHNTIGAAFGCAVTAIEQKFHWKSRK